MEFIMVMQRSNYQLEDFTISIGDVDEHDIDYHQRARLGSADYYPGEVKIYSPKELREYAQKTGTVTLTQKGWTLKFLLKPFITVRQVLNVLRRLR